MRTDENIDAETFRLRVLRSMTPEQRLLEAFGMCELTRRLFEQGLRRRFAHLPETEFRALLRRRLDLCHNRNY